MDAHGRRRLLDGAPRPDALRIELFGHTYGVLGAELRAAFRTELASYIFGGAVCFDDFYSLGHRARTNRYSRRTEVARTDQLALFRYWTANSPLWTRRLTADEVLDFRAKHGTVSSLIAEIQPELLSDPDQRELDRLSAHFAATMDQRVLTAKRVLSESHSRKAVILNGLLSTLGSVLGGPVGAVVGGIGGVIVSNVALDYDQRSRRSCFFRFITPRREDVS